MPAHASPDSSTEARLSLTLGALADPTRRAMLARLSKGSATAGELAQPFDIGLPTVSKHLRTLEQAGLVRRVRNAQWHVFHLQPEPLSQLASWLQTYQTFWADTLDSLEAYVRTFERTGRSGTKRAPGVTRSDAKGGARRGARGGGGRRP